MSGLFQSLEIGKRALLSHQVVLQTIGHNIANVNTPGYSRQRVSIVTTIPENSQFGPVGSGIKVNDIRHVRDLFLGQQYREAQKSLGNWAYQNKTLSQIESVFNEPQDNSLADALNDFWNDWSSLSTDAESHGHRSNLLASSQRLVNGFKQLSQSLTELRDATDRDLENITSDINRLTTEVARINQQITETELGDSQANDLRDMRDHLTDQLSGYIDVNTQVKANGTTVVAMGGMILVDGSDSIDLDAVVDHKDNQATHRLVWKGTNVELRNVNGQLAGLMETRDETIPSYLDRLNELSRTLVEEVNALHVSGYGLDGSTGVNFFDANFTDASAIRINSEVLFDSNKIAISDSSNPDDRGNARIATAISALRESLAMGGGTATFNEFYNSLVGALGVEAKEAQSFEANYELLSRQIENKRQSVQGVSLDEEMANMVKFQHAYDAAARVITAMDQALDTVISGMGIVGR